MGMKKKQTLQGLKAGRPPLAKASRSMSRKASRALINRHHQLEKSRCQAAARGDKTAELAIAAELDTLGGLNHYQQASLQGQSLDRGGDTSRVLLQWLPPPDKEKPRQTLKMLEVGALSTMNACSTSGLFEMVHIDLNSQEIGIQQQDFMKRPLPEDDSGKFDLISLSLVLNFVPDAALRGEMLKRTLSFLNSKTCSSTVSEIIYPSLFVVLPRSCLENSRYFTQTSFTELMAALGYAMVRSKMTQKLAYSLWHRIETVKIVEKKFPKQEVNPGRTRNNFAITLTSGIIEAA